MRTRSGCLCAAVLLLAACSGGGDGRSTAEREIRVATLQRAVLRAADLPAVFTRFAGGKIVGSDLQPGPRENLDRFGRLGGWVARYKRSGTATTPGPLVIASFVDAFPDGAAADGDLGAYEHEFRLAVGGSGGSARQLAPPRIGDEAVVMERTLKGTPATVFFTVAWRFHNVTASVAADGFDGRLTLAQTVALAREQQRRIAALVPPG